MYIDGRTITRDTVIEGDICIVGAGAAGITMARELEALNAKIVLVESGGFEFDEATHRLTEGEVTGVPYFPLSETRSRYFGGSTNCWSGLCRPLDEEDFKTREWDDGYSGWPIGRQELDRYYQAAQEICDLGPYRYDPGFWESGRRKKLKFGKGDIRTVIFQYSPPTRFGRKYRETLDRSKHVVVLLHSNVTSINEAPGKGRIEDVEVKTIGGNHFFVKADYFVLATGGIENARLMLASMHARKLVLGKEADSVGKYFMEHLVVRSGQLASDVRKINEFYTGKNIIRGTTVRAALIFGENALRRFRISNVSILFGRVPPPEGITSAKYLYGRILEKKPVDDLFVHIGNIMSDIDDVAAGVFRRIVGKAEVGLFDILSFSEQSPNRDSKIVLSHERDALGNPLPKLYWKFKPIDMRTVRQSRVILAREFGAAGIGRVRLGQMEDIPEDLRGGRHHMGTTRMSRSAEDGVVDKNCKVHGLENLYIAGSSVFPTSGSANPTLTIVALAVRLAKHMTETLK